MKHIRSSGQVVSKSSGSRSTSAPRDSGGDGSYTCCQCENSKLFFALENASTIDSEKVTYPQSFVSGGSITHRIKLTCKADVSATRIIEFPALDCSTVDCQTLDLSGEYVGSCEIGLIYFGNNSTCSTAGGQEADECPTSLPPYTWSDSSQMVMSSAPGVRYSGVDRLQPEFRDSALGLDVELQALFGGIARAQFRFVIPTSISSFARIVLQWQGDVSTGLIQLAAWPNDVVASRILLHSIPLDSAAHSLQMTENNGAYSFKFDGSFVGTVSKQIMSCERAIADIEMLFASGATGANTLTLNNGTAGFY